MASSSKALRSISLTWLDRKSISLEALVDERTLLRALAGKPIRDISRERIRRVLTQRGLLSLLPALER